MNGNDGQEISGTMNRKGRRAEQKQARSAMQGASPGVQQVFADALGHHQAGRLKDAERLYRQILAVDPRHSKSLHMLGVVASQVGRSDLAVDLIGKAIGINAREASYHSNLGVALQAQGKLDEAVACYRQALVVRPDYAEAHYNLGNTLQAQGKLDEAVACYRQALVVRPDYAEAHYNLGNALKAQGRLDEAVACYRQALVVRPDYVMAHNNLGAVLEAQDKLDEAVACYRQAIVLRPDNAEAHYNLGNALKAQGRLDDAVACYRQALVVRPDYAEAHNNLGVVLEAQEKLDEAVACYRQAIVLKPDNAEVHYNLCGIYEKQNRLDDCEKAIEAARLNCGENNNEILIRRAQLSFRRKEFGEALECLVQVQVGKISTHQTISGYYNLLGKTYDKLERFDEAFAAFEQQNKSTSVSLAAQKCNAATFFERIEQLRDSWRSCSVANWSEMHLAEGDPTLAFLIGFPRSGTTLLDSILRSHPNISVVEEKPMVRRMDALLPNIETPDVLNSLTRSQILKLRDAYFNELSKHLDGLNRDKVVVDKLPLNIISVGLIYRVFPKAKFILALRHPYDCVLSCFFQDFKLNTAMANFLSLTRSAELYAAIMELWQVYVDRLNLNFSTVRYEFFNPGPEGNRASCHSIPRVRLARKPIELPRDSKKENVDIYAELFSSS